MLMDSRASSAASVIWKSGWTRPRPRLDPGGLERKVSEEPFAVDPRLMDALRGAAEYARTLGSASVDTEHLLLGFVRSERDVFAGVSNAAVRERLFAIVTRHAPIDPGRELPYAASLVKALGLPEPTRPRTNASISGPADVLLAILEDAGSTAGQVLRSLGVSSKEHLNL
jgi:ATP-dependent Clp protease ATP-binding subunit ClpA